MGNDVKNHGKESWKVRRDWWYRMHINMVVAFDIADHRVLSQVLMTQEVRIKSIQLVVKQALPPM